MGHKLWKCSNLFLLLNSINHTSQNAA